MLTEYSKRGPVTYTRNKKEVLSIYHVKVTYDIYYEGLKVNTDIVYVSPNKVGDLFSVWSCNGNRWLYVIRNVENVV